MSLFYQINYIFWAPSSLKMFPGLKIDFGFLETYKDLISDYMAGGFSIYIIFQSRSHSDMSSLYYVLND